MIEIPDLADVPYAPNPPLNYDSEEDPLSPPLEGSLDANPQFSFVEDPTDLPYSSPDMPNATARFEMASLQAHSVSDETVYNNTTGFGIRPDPLILPVPHSLRETSAKPQLPPNHLDSAISLALSDVSQINAQVLEYSTAQTVPVRQLNVTEQPVGQISIPEYPGAGPELLSDPNAAFQEPQIPEHPNDPIAAPPPATKMALAPYQSPDYARDVPLLFSLRLKPSLTQQFALPVHLSHTKPLPQLPPPMLAASIQKLTLANGDDLTLLRRNLATDSKTPAEYTLHIIFTQFVRHAERKLKLCLDYPLLQEPPVIDLLAEGLDPQFDKIVLSLGYIARRKPKPVIDSVMFWRKSKSEVASMAASEVERTISMARANLAKVGPGPGPDYPSQSTIEVAKNTMGRGKRSLSLMRTKSFSKISHRRNQLTSSASPSTNRSPSLSQVKSEVGDSEFLKQKAFYDEQIANARETAIQADRKSLALIYILCRVLIEVVKQTSPEAVGDDLGDKLEEIVYTQLKTTDPISTSESLVRSSNWNLFAELLGFMSEQRFLSVSDRFIADLEKVPASVKQEDEPRLHLLIHGMRYLKLTNYPLDRFEESAEFVQSLAKFFEKSHNDCIILAYCEVLSNLILPLANILTAEVNHPIWVEAIEKIYRKAYHIWSQALRTGSGSSSSVNLNNSAVNASNNAWAYSVHLMTAALAVSRKELFSKVWYDVIEQNMFKLRPKSETGDKTTLIICVSRLVWVYIYRLSDTLNNTIKRLDSLFDLLFFGSTASGKKQQWIVSDAFLINAVVAFVRVVGFQHLNYVLDNVLIKLLKMSFNGFSLENLSPEKLVVVIKSYVAILCDYELGKRPLFPTDDVLNAELLETTTENKNIAAKGIKGKKKNVDLNTEKTRLNEFGMIARNSNNAPSHDEICRAFASLLKLLDAQYGSDVWTTDNSSVSMPTAQTSSISQSAFSAFHFGIDFSYQSTKDLYVDLFANLIDAIPWTIVPLAGEKGGSSTAGVQFKVVVEILTRNSVHSNARVASAALASLRKLASRKIPSNMITMFAKIAFRFTDKPGPAYDSDYLNSPEFNRLLKIYVDLLQCWLKQFNDLTETRAYEKATNPLAQDDELMNKDVLNDLYQINHHKTDDASSEESVGKLKPGDELEWKTIITVIEEVEGNGLFFLCSQDSQTRHYGLSILKLVEQFDQAIYNITDQRPNSPTNAKCHSRSSSKFAADIGTRLIHVLEGIDFLDLIKPFKKDLSVPERSRLAKLRNKKNMLVKLAESDYGIDSALWFRLYPNLLDIFFEKCPMPVAMCRSIVCVRLVQMHELVFEFSENYRNFTSSLFSKSNSAVPPEVLVNQWKLYLVFACCSLTSTNDQKISFPSQPTHGRKRSLQIFIQHQKITSAKSVFRMVLPLLKSQQPMVRDAVKLGLSCININIFRTLLESLPSCLTEWDLNSKKRDSSDDRLRIETVHVLSNLAKRFRASESLYSDDWVIANLVSIIKNVKSFLSLPSVQIDVEFQRLRRHFCGLLESVFSGLRDKSDLNKWLPFEARIGCFNFLKEWCGFGDASDITQDRYTAMVSRTGPQKNTTAAILEIERKALQFTALSCMSAICSSPIKQHIEMPGSVAVMSFDIASLMGWIHLLLSSDNERAYEIGKNALKNVLVLNINNDEIFQEVIKQCYISQDSLRTTEAYFTVFADTFMEHRYIPKEPFDVFCMATFLVGCDSFEVRFSAIKILKFVELKYLKLSATDRFTEAACSRTKVVYKRALFDISAQLAALLPGSAFTCISYLTMYFSLVNNDTRRDILACLLPWVQNVELVVKEAENEPKNAFSGPKLDPTSTMVLNNLFAITVKFSSQISNEVEALWVALGSKRANFDHIIEYLMSNCLERKNPIFVEYLRQIVDYVAFSQPDPLYLLGKFIANLQPKAMVPQPQGGVFRPFLGDPSVPYVANLLDLIPYSEKDAGFSLVQLSMVFLVDLFTSQNDLMVEHLPLLLQVSFSLLDHYLAVVQEQASTMLIHLIHALAPYEPKSEETILALRQRDHFRYLWVYDDLNNDKNGARTPKNMDLLVRNTLEIFAPYVDGLQESWSRVSLSWATTCAVRHIACRSFQIFRTLLTFLDQGMLKDMLHRLSNTISDETVDIQGFAMQILMTLNAITAELDLAKLIDFPQLFWSSVACLSTVHEQEFIEVLLAMSKFVSKIDLDAPDTVLCLISTFPPKWEGKFEGLQLVVMVGLRSSTAWEPTMRFLDKINRLQDSDIIGMGDSRLLMAVVANLPRFLHELDTRSVGPDIEATAETLAKMAERCGKPALARILVSLAKNRFRSKKDFLVQTVATIRTSFFPVYEAQTLVLLLGFLSNSMPWVKLESMSILKHVLPEVDLQRDEFVGVGADLISPLLRLLLTDYAEPALEVLDEAVVISGSQLDKDVLRMSLGNAQMKKEYEKTATLFGIPDASGWAVPMPAVTAASTRNNVHAVFSTCAVTVEAENKDEEIHFHLEDYYAPSVEHGDAASASGPEPASLSNMWAALDDFDLFFTKETDDLVGLRRDMGPLHAHSASVDTKYSNASDPVAPMDLVPHVYDKKALVILNRSLARTQSNTLFKNSLADSIGPAPYANHPPATRRSYIPFRTGRNSVRAKNDSFTTPVAPQNAAFDAANSPYAASGTTSALLVTGPLEQTVLGGPGSENSTLFENLLSNKKKTKKVSKFPPNASATSISPDMPANYWTAQSPATQGAKRKGSQKFR